MGKTTVEGSPGKEEMSTDGIVDIKLESKSLLTAATFFNHLLIIPGTQLPELKSISLNLCDGAFIVRIITGVFIQAGIDPEVLKRVKSM